MTLKMLKRVKSEEIKIIEKDETPMKNNAQNEQLKKVKTLPSN